MGSVYLHGTLAWAVAQALTLGQIFFLIMIVAVKGRRREMMLTAGALALAALVSGAILGGPLALLVVGALGQRGWGAVGVGAICGVPIGLAEFGLLVAWSKGKSNFRKLAVIFGSVGAWSGGVVGFFAG